LRVLVTGAAGFVGQHTVRFLSERGMEVRGLDVQAHSATERVDITDETSLRRAVRRFDPEAIVHLAAFASVPGCESDPERCVRVNVVGTRNVAQAAAAADARLVFASSAAVYGDAAPLPTPISAKCEPTNLYGISKVAGESVCRLYRPDAVFLRFFNVYGEGCERSYVIPDIIRKLSRRPRSLSLQGTGREARDFVYVGDVVRAIELSLRGRFRGAFNVGSGKRTSIRALAAAIVRALGLPPVPIRFEGARAGDFRVSLADMSPSNRVPGWRSEVSLREGLRRVLAAS